MARFPIWAGILILGLTLSLGSALAFVGPTVSPGTGGGSLQLDASGNIGVGTSSSTPVSTFNTTSTESGLNTFGRVFMVASTTNPGVGLKNLTPTTGNTYIWSSRGFGNLQLYRESQILPGLVVIDINKFGDVAIGTSTLSTGASSKLAVGGDVKASAVNATLTGSVPASGVTNGVFSTGNFAFQNALGVGTTSIIGLPTNGLLVTGTTTLATTAGNVGIGILNPVAKLDVTQMNGSWALIIGADVSNSTRTNATRKFARFGIPHYTNSEEPVTLLTGDSDGTNNYVSIGGPTSAGNAPTIIRFFTAANHTTVTGSERMRIDSVGNVSIGTSTPATKFHIYDAASPVFTIESDWAAGDYGAIRFASVQQSGYQAEIASYAPGDSTRDLRFYTSNGSKTERVRILGNGNVGIKTTNPSSPLHVVGSTTITDDLYLTDNKSIRLDSAAATTLLVGNYNSGSFTYGTGAGTASLAVEGDVKGNRLCFGDADCQTSWTGIVASGGGNYWTQSGSYLYASSSSWSVGIGTAIPNTALEVMTGTTAEGDQVRINPSGRSIEIVDRYASDDYSAKIWANWPAVGQLHLGVNAAFGAPSTVVPTLTIYNSSGAGTVGSVGIGTSTPAGNLQIWSSSNTRQILSTGNGSNAYLDFLEAGSTWGASGTNGSRIELDGVNNKFNFYSAVGATIVTHLSMDRVTGNVGIGTTTPAKKLHIESGGANSAIFSDPITIGYPSVSTDAVRKDYVDNNFALSSGASGIWKLSGSNVYASSTAYNVAIGTTTPLAKMDIVGSLSNSTAAHVLVLARPYNSGIAWGSSASFKLANPNSGNDNTRLDIALDDAGANPYQLPGTTVMSLVSNGNVGIGTTAPGTNLEVVGASETTGTIRINGGKVSVLAVGEINSALEFNQRDSSVVGLIAGKIASISEFSNGAYAGLGFYTSKQGRTPELQEAMRINYDGNIGIGTTTPATLAHLYKSSGDSIVSIENTGDGNSSGINFIRERSTGTGINGGSIFVDSNTASTESLLYIQAQTAGSQVGNTAALTAANGVRLVLRGGYGIFSIENGATESFRIIANGNIGIGVADPGAAKLRVEGNTIVNGNINQLVATSYNYMVAPLSVGSASSPGTSKLYVNGFSNLALGAKVGSVAGGWLYYPNVLSYAANITSPGAIILNTNIGRTSNEMFKMRVLGYGYGNSYNIDFTVVGYAYSAQNGSLDGLAGAVVNYSVVDNGNDGMTKRIGVNSAGNVAVVVGDTNSSLYYYRMSVDYWSTRNAVDASSGWSFSTSTTANFGFLDIKTLSPAITEFADGTVGIGTNTDTTYKLYTNGTSYFNGQVTLAAAQQLTWSATNANNKIDLAGGDLTGVDKISAATVDPLYEIEGAKYSTYAPSMAGGVKEEYIGQAKLKKYTGKFYEYILNLEKEKKGSDLWVWFKAVDFSKDSIQATITPIGEPASVAYEIKDNSIIFRGSSATEFSFRLTGKRFDWREHPTYAKDQEESPNLIIK